MEGIPGNPGVVRPRRADGLTVSPHPGRWVFQDKWDWHHRDGYLMLVKAKPAVPPTEYQPRNFEGASYEGYVQWTLDLVDNRDYEEENTGNN